MLLHCGVVIGPYLSSSDAHLGAEVVYCLSREASSSESCECEQSRIIPVLNNPCVYQLGNLPLADDSVVHIEAAILPLDGTVDIHRIAQPIVGGPASIMIRLLCTVGVVNDHLLD